ncbi:MAG: PilX N-terminal domain-containing pilus assembly protein [Pseudomonadota bacterium]
MDYLPCQRRAGGLVLITTLVLLLILMLLGISGTQTMMLQTRMTTNLHQMHQAFQAAEAALRDGEQHINQFIDTQTVFSATCHLGLCASTALSDTPWNSNLINWLSGENTIMYGSQTGQLAFPVTTPQPRYIIERLPAADNAVEWYRVTAVSYNAQGEIQHILQSTYLQ